MPVREESHNEYVIEPGLYDTEAGYVFHIPGEAYPRVLLSHEGLFTGTGVLPPDLLAGGTGDIIDQVQNTLFGRAAGAGTGNPGVLTAAQAKTVLAITDVNDTSDADKPVSTATQTALDLKANKALWTTKGDLISATGASTPTRLAVGATDDHVLMIDNTTPTGLKWAEAPGTSPSPPTGAAGGVLSGSYPSPGFADQAEATILGRQAASGTGPAIALTALMTRTAIALQNVDNTSDANKPVSTAAQTALDLKAPLLNPTLTNLTAAGTLALPPGSVTAPMLATAARQHVANTILYDDFHRANQALHATRAPTGQLYTGTRFETTASDPQIVNGRFSTATAGAAYLEANLGTDYPDQISVEFVFNTGSTSSAAVGLISTIAGSPTLSVHLSILPGTWGLGFFETSVLNTVASGTFATPLTADGVTSYRVTLTRVGNQMILDLPAADLSVGQTVLVTDTRTTTYWGSRVLFENYQPSASFATDKRPEILSITASRLGGAMSVPKALVTAKGDLLTATATATPARLAVGTNGYFLIADSAEATGMKWGPEGTLATDAVWDAKGDLIAATGANAATRLAVGTNTHVLTADSAEATGLKWAVAPGAGVATDTIWNAKGDLAGGTGSDTAARLAVGTNGHVLTADSGESTGLKWAAAGSGAVGTDAIWDAKGDIAVATAADTAVRLAVGAAGTVLTADASETTGTKWVSPQTHVEAYRPTGALAETVPRGMHPLWTSVSGTLLSGRMSLFAIALVEGVTYSTITFLTTGTAAGTPTNQIFGLYNSSLAKKAESNNDTTTAWAGNSRKTLTFGTPYVAEYTGLFYVAIMITGGTMPTLAGIATSAITGGGTPQFIVPALCGESTTGLTTALPDPAAAITVASGLPWAYLS